MKGLLEYFGSRLREPSTWRGIIAMFTAAGISLDPDQVAGIVAAGVALMGVIGAFAPDAPAESRHFHKEDY